ncbi:MAG: NRDE family protein [Balneolaceae bacterium]|nr:MAG: NRDE family protein [Balneolaceae bacterium]
MCLLLISFQIHPRYPLIVAGNRDEFYDRATQPLHAWSTTPVMAAGKDLKGGGTWLGISEKRRFAAVTNYRNPAALKSDVRSRGDLVTEFLLSPDSVPKILSGFGSDARNYNGFNLIAGDHDSLWYLNEEADRAAEIPPGIHVISNARLNTQWPKSKWALNKFSELTTSEALEEEKLFELLLNDQTFPESELPSTGVPKEMEKKLSALFIRMNGYGTRSSAVVTLDRKGVFTFSERMYINGDQTSFSYRQEKLSTADDR